MTPRQHIWLAAYIQYIHTQAFWWNGPSPTFNKQAMDYADKIANDDELCRRLAQAANKINVV